MSTRSKKRKPVRIEGEASQAWGTPAKAKKLTAKNELDRKLVNRIHELEQQIATLSRGGNAKGTAVYLSPAVLEVVKRLTASGFYGDTETETITELLNAKVRSEMAWLATGAAP